MSQATQIASNAKIYQISKTQLPLSCPTHDMILWNAHPRVYLPIEETGSAICPYCGAKFILRDNEE